MKPVDVTDLLLDQVSPKEPQRTVVRLRTTLWADRKGFHLKKDLTFLKRQCLGYNILADDLENSGARDVYPRILNLSTAEDGVYEVVKCYESRVWESCYVEDWDYRLKRIDDDVEA
jgi:hypothetical protein